MCLPFGTPGPSSFSSPADILPPMATLDAAERRMLLDALGLAPRTLEAYPLERKLLGTREHPQGGGTAARASSTPIGEAAPQNLLGLLLQENGSTAARRPWFPSGHPTAEAMHRHKERKSSTAEAGSETRRSWAGTLTPQPRQKGAPSQSFLSSAAAEQPTALEPGLRSSGLNSACVAYPEAAPSVPGTVHTRGARGTQARAAAVAREWAVGAGVPRSPGEDALATRLAGAGEGGIHSTVFPLDPAPSLGLLMPREQLLLALAGEGPPLAHFTSKSLHGNVGGEERQLLLEALSARGAQGGAFPSLGAMVYNPFAAGLGPPQAGKGNLSDLLLGSRLPPCGIPMSDGASAAAPSLLLDSKLGPRHAFSRSAVFLPLILPSYLQNDGDVEPSTGLSRQQTLRALHNLLERTTGSSVSFPEGSVETRPAAGNAAPPSRSHYGLFGSPLKSSGSGKRRQQLRRMPRSLPASRCSPGEEELCSKRGVVLDGDGDLSTVKQSPLKRKAPNQAAVTESSGESKTTLGPCPGSKRGRGEEEMEGEVSGQWTAGGPDSALASAFMGSSVRRPMADTHDLLRMLPVARCLKERLPTVGHGSSRREVKADELCVAQLVSRFEEENHQPTWPKLFGVSLVPAASNSKCLG